MRTLKFLIPLAIFLAIALFLLKGLSRDPREIPSPLVGKPAPVFELPVLQQPDKRWSTRELQGQVWLLNVWGSWCAGCQVEHPLLNEIARRDIVPIVGLAWKDKPDAALRWLDKLGNPYATTVTDLDGKVAIDWGVYGAPETFLVDRGGTIRYKHIGPLTAEVIENRLLPEVKRWQADSR